MLRSKVQGAAGSGYVFTANISSNQQELNLATWANSQGWDGSSKAEITVDANVYIWSNSNSTAALTTGNFPKGVTLIVEGYIIGKGGSSVGFNLADPRTFFGTSEINGGPAISLSSDITIKGANGYIGGGGGAGATLELGLLGENYTGGGGAGGGNSGSVYNSDNELLRPGAIGGSVGNVGGDGDVGNNNENSNGKGGGAGGGGGASS